MIKQKNVKYIPVMNYNLYLTLIFLKTSPSSLHVINKLALQIIRHMYSQMLNLL